MEELETPTETKVFTMEDFKNFAATNEDAKSYLNLHANDSVENWKKEYLDNIIKEEVGKVTPKQDKPMTEQDRQIQELRNELDSQRREAAQAKSWATVKDNIVNSGIEGLNDQFVQNFLISDDINETNERFNQFKAVADMIASKAADKAVKDRFGTQSAFTPATGGAAKAESFGASIAKSIMSSTRQSASRADRAASYYNI